MEGYQCLMLLVLILYTKTTYSTTCTCDLIGHQCNVNCCCDPDCNEEEKKIFSTCITLNNEHIEEICVSDSLLFSVNGKYQIQGSGGGLLCLYKNNYNARFFYSDIIAVNSLAAFELLANKYRRTSYGVEAEEKTNYENSFKVGDPLFILFSTNQQGFLPQPISFFTNECEDSNPARFLLPAESDCFRLVKNISQQCTTERSWNARSYIEGYKVAPFPSFIFGGKRTEVKSTNSSESNKTVNVNPMILMNNSQLIEPSLFTFLCRDKSGVAKTCPFIKLPTNPSYNNTTKICSNVVHQVLFNIIYKHDLTVKIREVNVSFVLGEISSSFLQRNLFSFTPEENIASNITNKSIPYLRSGNPGYIIGLPVVVAVIEGEGDHKRIYPSNMNSTVKFTTIKTTSNGMCNVQGVNENINFGVDLRTGCFMTIDNVMSLSKCEQLQKEIYSNLLGKLPTHVGSFGNPDHNKFSDWVPIVNGAPASQPALSNGQCFNIHTSVLFEFLYASTGFLKNPQRKIVGIHVKYGSARNLIPQCFGLFCQSSKKEKMEIVQSVSFIDVTLTPQAEVKSKPQFRAKAPHDFFYPFLT